MSTSNPFVGSWTYRSYLNLPQEVDGEAKIKTILFGQARLDIEGGSKGEFTGLLDMGGEYILNVTGSIGSGTPVSIRFTGVGDTGPVKGWVYDYTGWLVPSWPKGVDQVPAFVGSVIRTEPHDGRPAGVTASFVCVRRPPPQSTDAT